MAQTESKWTREKAARRLAGPVEIKRNTDTIVGKVDCCFEEIHAARIAGKTWKQIARELDPDEPPHPESAESSFRRICTERGVPMPKSATRKARTAAKPQVQPAVVEALSDPSDSDDDLFQTERWKDDGDD